MFDVSAENNNAYDSQSAQLKHCIKYLMLVSHCGEYTANGLTNAVRHEFVMIANDRQTFVAVRMHSRSFMWCCEY